MFSNIQRTDKNTYKFRLAPLHVSYANALRRIITSHVESVGFRADMTDKGTTTDVLVMKNDTPMSNEMLAERIGLLPINVRKPLEWNPDKYQFIIKIQNDTKEIIDVKASDFKVIDKETEEVVSTDEFFPADYRSGDTPLIAILRPATYLQGINLKKQTGGEKKGEELEIYATATIGKGKEHCRFSPVTCCVFPYTRDEDPAKVDHIFKEWLLREKKIVFESLEKDREAVFRREFNTMAIARSFLQDSKGEPYSYDVTIESMGVLDIPYIMDRACQIGKELFMEFAGVDAASGMPEFITISPTGKEMIGFDFHIRGQDAHTIGNSLQTWIVDNLIDGDSQEAKDLQITFAGYDEGHPLDNLMKFTIGVADGKEMSARKAVAMAARGLVSVFDKLQREWRAAVGIKEDAEIPTTKRRVLLKRKEPSVKAPVENLLGIERDVDAPLDSLAEETPNLLGLVPEKGAANSGPRTETPNLLGLGMQQEPAKKISFDPFA
jgi:DNA-directed RNA polymerase subunit L